MFESLFRKNKPRNADESEAQDKSALPLPQDRVATSPLMSPADLESWRNRIRAAADDAALLQLLAPAPATELKLTILQALTQEESFRHAMREFRGHDKRLYRAAQLRWQSAKAQRVLNDEAGRLIAAARELLDQPTVPVNRVVELDRAWAALNVQLLDQALPAEFAALSTQLSAKVRAYGEQAQSLTHWSAVVDVAIQQLTAVLPAIARGDHSPAEGEALAVALLDLLAKVPDASDAHCIEKTELANRHVAAAYSVVQRANFLQALPASGATDVAGEKILIDQWREFPELSDRESNALQSLLAQRFAAWRNANKDAHQQDIAANDASDRARRAEREQQRVSAIQHEIDAAEVAHAAGQVAELARCLEKIDSLFKPGLVDNARAQRIEFLRRELAKLRDWQRWSGTQSREQLVVEAQALAQLATGNVAIKQHADAIAKLRLRWKELDKLGGEFKQSVWLSFDAALNAAYAPVAAQMDKQKRARQENLALRNEIIASLVESAKSFFPDEGVAAADAAQPDWRAVTRAIQQARSAWQKLGPVAHTVPRDALHGDSAVAARYAAALAALEAPLNDAYDLARRQREQLIAAATELSGAPLSDRELPGKVRTLQAQWQAIAKAVPLPRHDENSLWIAFKGATDKIFSARDAARAAAEETASAHIKAREEIIERVAQVAAANSAPEIKRALSAADVAWRGCEQIAKPLQIKLEARYRAARERAEQRLGELALRTAQARYDSLLIALALCGEREALQDSDPTVRAEQNANLDARWRAIEHLPDAWKAALDARFKAAAQASPEQSAESAMLDALLNLEVACDIASPAAYLADRQRLKLRALKNAMEGRQSSVHTPADIERWLITAVSAARPDALSRQRLESIIAALRGSQTRK